VFARCWVHSTNKTSALLRKVKASGLKRAYSTKQAAEGGNGLPGGSATGLPLYRESRRRRPLVAGGASDDDELTFHMQASS
jgi:hypothetical protein